MRKLFMIAVVLLSTVLAKAQDNSNRVGLGVGGFYRPAASATLYWEHETHYHNAWEFFATGSVKLDNLEDIETNYRFWGVGTAWKPCVFRARNRYGSARIGVSLGAAPADFLAGIHAGWQHSYALRGGWQFYWQAGVDLMLPKRDDLFRVGAGFGIKMPVRIR